MLEFGLFKEICEVFGGEGVFYVFVFLYREWCDYLWFDKNFFFFIGRVLEMFCGLYMYFYVGIFYIIWFFFSFFWRVYKYYERKLGMVIWYSLIVFFVCL